MSVDLLSAIRSAATELTADERAEPILVGVSGGPDSLALLHALGRWRAEGGPAIAAIHVDHKLRPGSADEARQVAAWCVEWGIPFAGRAVETDRAPVANIEQIAREGRYRCFAAEAARLGALTLALAHHADDQAETLLLHLLRGSGLAGLTGMPVVRRAGDRLDPICAALGVSRPAIWRPLLAVRRAAMLAYCDRWHLAPSTTHRRRHGVAAQCGAPSHRAGVGGVFPGAGGILARNAALLADDEDVLRAMSTKPGRVVLAVSEPGLVILDRAAHGRAPSDAAASVARDLGAASANKLLWSASMPRCG
ncbi:MAG: tRNA lysidine(34) synthetase TilS [Thermomicrobiales bacterium]